MRVFSVFAPDSIGLIFTKFIDISVLHAGKRVKMGRRGMCSASGHVLQMPLWASTRRSERFLPTRHEGEPCKQCISAWKPMEGSQGNCPKFGRLYASAVKRSRPKRGR